MANFAISGTDIKNPTTFDIELYTISQATRVESGDMVMDFVANKRKFKFTYAAITAQELNTIIDLLWTNLTVTRTCFVTLEYVEDGVAKQATVYSGSISKSLHRASGTANWVWKNVSFNLIER